MPFDPPSPHVTRTSLIIVAVMFLSLNIFGRIYPVHTVPRPPTRATPAWATHYAALGISPYAEKAEVAEAWRRLSDDYHPDRIGHAPQNIRKYYGIQNAYYVLSSDANRCAYDIERKIKGNWTDRDDECTMLLMEDIRDMKSEEREMAQAFPEKTRREDETRQEREHSEKAKAPGEHTPEETMPPRTSEGEEPEEGTSQEVVHGQGEQGTEQKNHTQSWESQEENLAAKFRGMVTSQEFGLGFAAGSLTVRLHILARIFVIRLHTALITVFMYHLPRAGYYLLKM